MQANSLLIWILLLSFGALLLAGVRVAWALGGSAFMLTCVASLLDHFAGIETDLDFQVFSLVINRIYKLMDNWVLICLPMFILMGHVLDRSGVAENLMQSIQKLMGNIRGGLAIGVTLIGVLLAASTGIIGASVVLLGILALPTMLKQNYEHELAVGTVCGAGTLGILIPPSIMLIIMADQLRLSVGDLFMGAVLPGLLLAILYVLYILIRCRLNATIAPISQESESADWKTLLELVKASLPALMLIILVLGSIFFGIATPTEASGLGASGAFILAAMNRKLTMKMVQDSIRDTTKTLGFLFAIFIGATCFSLVLRLLGGDEMAANGLHSLSLGPHGMIVLVLIIVFLLGFFLDWIEITIIVLPVVAPFISQLDFNWITNSGLDAGDQPALLWFAILFAVTLQTSFLTPPVGFALFYLKGVCPPEISLKSIYRGAVPFIILQIAVLIILILFPEIITRLPAMRY